MLPPEALWQALQEHRPRAARLALLSCLPVRVTPAFLRLVRLRLLVDAGTGDEADLWLSDLVETRSSAGLSYRRGVRELLREQLAADSGLLDAVWTQVHREHLHWLAARSQLEEELTWRLLRDPGDAWIDERWQAVLVELDRASNAEGVARWVVRAVPDLPPGALDIESARRAYYGANLLLGDASVLGTEAQTFLDSDRFAFATRRLPRRRIHVGRVEGGVMLSQLRPIEHGFELDIPATRPLWIQVEGGAGASRSAPQVITLADHETLAFSTGSNEVKLRLIDGSAYAIGPPRPRSEKFIARNRAPRVQIEYDVELYGAEKKVQLPFVTGVLADLSGRPTEPLPPLADRKFLEIDVDNFDARLKAMRPRVAFQLPDMLRGEGSMAIDIGFESLDDFAPAAVARRVHGTKRPLEARQQLAGLLIAMEGKVGAQEVIAATLKDVGLVKSLAMADLQRTHTATDAPALQGFELEGEDLAALLAKHFKATSDDAKSAVEQAVLTLATQVLEDPSAFSSDAQKWIETLIAGLDRKLSETISAILHHDDFQALEGAWRGLRYLVDHTETDEMLKIRVMNVSKREIGECLDEFKGDDWDQSPLFKKIYEEEFGQFGGQPFGCLVGDFQFDHSPPDVELLAGLARIAAAAHAPFVAAASPTLMQMASWQELANPRDLTKIFAAPEYQSWRSLRESEDAMYLGLAMPRFLARLPYGARSHQVEDFVFEEDTGVADHGKFTWTNSAYAMAVNVNRSFKLYGWCALIRGIEAGGVVEGLPAHAFPTDDGGIAMRSPTEIAISDRREAELAKNGLMPLLHRRNSDVAAFVSAPSLHKPTEYDDPDATANAVLMARLPYLFGACRFMHYVKCMVRDKIGAFRDREETQRWLQNWILNYVDGDPDHSSEVTKARYPLAAAEVVVEADESRADYYTCKLFVRPHYQLEGLTVSMRLVTKLPSARAA